MTKNCDLINKLTDVVITYDFDDCTETVDRDMIKNWLTTDENGLYTLDKKQIEAYISELAAKYDTVGTERTFNTYDGREITVSGGNYGWQIDQKAELKELTELIKNGETQVREPVYSHEGLVRKTNDIGYTYIEIDLTAQRMVFYKDGTPTADAQIVSGNPFVPNCATPVGCYTTGEMKSGCTVNGEDYPSAVNYWIPFDGNLGSVMLHGEWISEDSFMNLKAHMEASVHHPIRCRSFSAMLRRTHRLLFMNKGEK